jgi:hypothetical protein
MSALAFFAALAVGTTGLTPSQRDDLACLGLSKVLAQGRRPVDPMARYFLRLLRETDAKRDWLSDAPDYRNRTYRDFIDMLEVCQHRMPRSGGPVR